ncbi:MAG: cyclopropane fatty acyl phospholipid synthase [Nanoarchaeota archaeon]
MGEYQHKIPSKLISIGQKILDPADIKINGNRDWDIQVHDPSFYSRVLSKGSIALGETYMEGLWDCKALDVFFYKIFNAKLDKKVQDVRGLIWASFKAKISNLQDTSRAYEVGEKHYDIGNELYKKMLDKRMVYTCGYWKDAKNLDQAQEAKLDLVCKKINLKKGMKVLDIGCGWGSFAKYAAEKYKANVVGITISKEQIKLAKEMCKGLPVKIRLQDYRNVNEQFDAIISLGMFEHVGPKNYETYMKVVHRCLKQNGLFLLHTIGRETSGNTADPWFDKYIFPNGILPSVKQISQATEGLFVMEDFHNFGSDYDKTLMAWYHNFKNNWNDIKKTENYNERFFRMWCYYLTSLAGCFRARQINLWQIVFSKDGVPGGYKSIR